MTEEPFKESQSLELSGYKPDALPHLIADVLEPRSVVLFVADHENDRLVVKSSWSLTDSVNTRSWAPIHGSLLGDIFLKGTPRLYNCRANENIEPGFYDSNIKVGSYMAGVINRRALLWADSNQAHKFTAKDLKIFLGFVDMVSLILRITDFAERDGPDQESLHCLTSLLKHNPCLGAKEDENLIHFLEQLCSTLQARAALSARRDEDRGGYLVNGSVGFPPAFKPGRKLRLERGLVSGAIEKGTPLVAQAHELGNTNLVTFNPYERFGFQVKTLYLIPWKGLDQEIGGFMVSVDDSIGHAPVDQGFLETLASAFALIRSREQSRALVSKIRNYDAESGVLSEAAFHANARNMFSSAKTKGVSLALTLALINDMDEIYLSHEPHQVCEFLESFADGLSGLTGRPHLLGKFRTGIFGLIIDGVTRNEMKEILEAASARLGHGAITIGSQRFLFNLKVSGAHFPEDAQDLVGLWRRALEGVGLTLD